MNKHNEGYVSNRELAIDQANAELIETQMIEDGREEGTSGYEV